MLEMWKACFNPLCGTLIFITIIGILWSIGLFFYRVYQNAIYKPLPKNRITFKRICDTTVCLMIITFIFYFILAIIVSISLYFYKSWEHINQPQQSGLTISGCNLNGKGINYQQSKDGFYVDFTDVGKTEGLKIGDWKNE